MKFLHTSDLHIGKRLYEASLLQDQKYILEQITKIAVEECVQAVLISGDVYDKPIPQADAVTLFDSFITTLASQKIKVFIISGNHDSAQRLDFMSSLLSREGVYFCGSYKGKAEYITLYDEYGEINIYMLPFIRPANVRQFDENAQIGSYEDAVKYVIDHAEIDTLKRNIVLSHQFITGASGDNSEELIIGGLDNISADVYSVFDYTALGHIHRRQSIGNKTVIYSGTPLKYSFSEVNNNKSVTIVEMKEKGNTDIYTRELIPMREMICLKGSFDEIINQKGSNDYVRVILTDEKDIPEAVIRIRNIFPNTLTLEYDNTRTRTTNKTVLQSANSIGTPLEMFGQLYERQQNQPMTAEQLKIMESLIKKIWGDEM